jgi:hypothetical protein
MTHQSLRFLPAVLAALLAVASSAHAIIPGNVEVELSATGKLLVTGDEGANSITIEEDIFPDFFTVIGNDGTTINGFPGGDTFGPVTGDIVVRMRHGGNSVLVEDVGAPAAIKISTGNGDDIVELNNVGALGDIRVTTKKGNDDVLLDFFATTADLQVKTANGDDTVEVKTSGSFVTGETRIVTGTGVDFFGTSEVFYGGKIKVQLGSDADEMSSAFNDYGEFEANGQGGVDTFESFSDSFFFPPVLKSFELVVI